MKKVDHLKILNKENCHSSSFDIGDTVPYENAIKTINLALKFGSGDYFLFVEEKNDTHQWYMPDNPQNLYPDRKYNLIHKKYKQALIHSQKNGKLQYLWKGGFKPEWKDFAHPTSQSFVSETRDSFWNIRLLDEDDNILLTI